MHARVYSLLMCRGLHGAYTAATAVAEYGLLRMTSWHKCMQQYTYATDSSAVHICQAKICCCTWKGRQAAYRARRCIGSLC